MKIWKVTENRHLKSEKEKEERKKKIKGYIILIITGLFAAAALTITLLFLGCNPAHGQSVFQKTLDSPGDDYGYAIKPTNDGNLITTGQTSGYPCLIKLDTNGNKIWARKYTDSGNLGGEGRDVIPTSDGGYLLTGIYNDGPGADVLLIKTDQNGVKIWTKTYGGTSYEYGYSVLEAYGGGCIIVAQTASFGTGLNDDDIYIIRIDEAGNLIWSKNYGGNSLDFGYSIQKTNDNDYIITGYTTSYGVGGDIVLMKIDTSGNVLWCKAYGGSQEDYGFTVRQTEDNSFIISGETWSVDSGFAYLCVIKTDSIGNLIWSKYYGNGNFVRNLGANIVSDGYIFTGYMQKPFSSDDYPCSFTIKTNTNGDIVWFVNSIGTESDYGYSIATINDQYFTLGETQSYGSNASAMYLSKKNQYGDTACYENNYFDSARTAQFTATDIQISVYTPQTVVDMPIFNSSVLNVTVTDICFGVGTDNADKLPINTDNILIYPDPFNDFAIVSTPIINSDLYIYDSFGRQVRKIKIISKDTELKRENLASGIYFYQSEKYFGKFMIY